MDPVWLFKLQSHKGLHMNLIRNLVYKYHLYVYAQFLHTHAYM